MNRRIRSIAALSLPLFVLALAAPELAHAKRGGAKKAAQKAAQQAVQKATKQTVQKAAQKAAPKAQPKKKRSRWGRVGGFFRRVGSGIKKGAQGAGRGIARGARAVGRGVTQAGRGTNRTATQNAPARGQQTRR